MSTRRACEQVEQVDRGRVLALDEADLQVPHEPGRRHPEVVADHHDRLDVLAVALAQGGDQLRVRLVPPGEQPLLELVEDQQDLLARPQNPPPPQRGQRVDQVQPGGKIGTDLAQCPRAAGPRSPPASPRCTPAARRLPSRGSNPALTSDDLPQPDGP